MCFWIWKTTREKLYYRNEKGIMKMELFANHRRYIDNPCLNEPDKVADFISEDWLKEQIRSLTNTLTTRRISVEECEEGGAYTGIGGVSYAIFRASQSLAATSKDHYLNLCHQLLNSQLINAKNASKGRLSRYLTGTLGLYTIQAILLHSAGTSIDSIVELYRSLLPIVLVPGYQKIGDDEVMNGRAGFLVGVLLLRMETGKEILSDAEIRKVLDAIIASGRTYSRENGSEARLMYQWHNSEYLGAAHGVSGIYQVLMSFWNLLNASEKSDLIQCIDWYVSLQSDEGNFPSSSEDRGNNELVHWCHGATGAIQMLITAHIVTEEAKYLESAKLCTDVIWNKGILRKGPGICHGVAGSGYAFLLMYRLTGQLDYLAKAKTFAGIMMNSNFAKLARVPDCPFSLFEGWAGALCFLCDLLHPKEAQFPMVPIVFQGSFKASQSSSKESSSCQCAE